MKQMLIFILCFFFLSLPATIKPHSNFNPYFNDPFFVYQWGLSAQNQIFIKDLTDIKSKKIHISPKASIGFFEPHNQPLTAKMKKEVVVAVIDSGLDISHKDLKGTISLSSDCNELHLPPTGKAHDIKDKDKNGYRGDCMGWNFSVKDGNNKVYDDKGHGTHVSSIISATSNNDEGIASLSAQIKILPIKIFRNTTEKEKSTYREEKENYSIDFSENIIKKAIDYAVSKNVDVINMSFGWPLVIQHPSLTESLQKALDKNITIVAAAGNSHHNAFILPCAIEGVLCVGASNGLGKLAEFSNYGGHVDLLAPGEEIFGALPLSQATYERTFSIPGYGPLTGTSQAAPWVSSAVAFLKGIFPQIQNDEIKARLFLSSSHFDEHKKTLHGLFNLKKAIEVKKNPVIRPIFKSQKEVELINGQAKIKFKLKNYWETTKNSIKISVSTIDPPIQKYSFTYPQGLKNKEIKTISFNLSLPYEWVHSKISLLVSIQEGDGKKEDFFHEVDVFKSFQLFSSQKISIPINHEIQLLLKERFKSKRGITPFFEIGKPSGSPSYYLTKTEEGGTKVFIWKKGRYGLDLKEVFIPNLLNGQGTLSPSLIKYDFNHDGKDDYLISGLSKKHDESNKDFEQTVLFSFFDHNLEPLFKNISHHWKQKFQRIVFRWENPKVRFLTYSFEGEKISLPFLIGRNYPPEKDLLTHPDDAFLNRNRNYIFYLHPVIKRNSQGNEEVILEERILDSYHFMKNLKEKLTLHQKSEKNIPENLNAENPLTTLQFLSLFPQKNKEELKGLLAIGEGGSKKYYIIHWKSKFLENNFKEADYDIRSLDYGNKKLDGNTLQTLFRISKDKVLPSESYVFIRHYKDLEKPSRVLISGSENNSKTASVFTPSFKNKSDRLTYFKKAYETDEHYIVFYESQNQIIAKTIPLSKKDNLENFTRENKEGKTFFKRVIRSALFPDVFFSERLSPLVIKRGTVLKPALYVNASEIYSQKVFLWFLDEHKGEFFAPIKYSLKVPKNCLSLKPTPYGEGDEYKAVFMCQRKKDSNIFWTLYYYTFN